MVSSCLQGNKHKQISDRLRDAQSKKRIQKAEVDLINQKRDARVAEISTLQLQFEVKAKVFVSPVCLDKLKSLKLFLWMYFDFFFLYAWATGMAEEAVSAGPGTTEADREAAEHQPQQTLMWVTNVHLHTTQTPATEFSLSYLWPFFLWLLAASLTSVSTSVTEKGVNCRRLKDQLDTLERETTDKLTEMEQYNRELKVSGRHRSIQHVESGKSYLQLVAKVFRPFEN